MSNRLEKYNNQEYIGLNQDGLTYYHNNKLITVGHSSNYNEVTIAGNPSQSLELDDSVFDKFICREKDKKEVCQTLSNQSTMLNEYDFRLISDLPIRNIQKIVTVDYTEFVNSYDKYQLTPTKNGMMILYDEGKIGYYDWNRNSLIEKAKTEANNGDGHILYKDRYIFPYIKDENIIDVQSDFGTTTIATKNNRTKSHIMIESYADTQPGEVDSTIGDCKVLGKLYNNVIILHGGNLRLGEKRVTVSVGMHTNLQCLKDGVYDFNEMKKYEIYEGRFILDIDFTIPSVQSKDKLVAIKEVLNGYLLIQVGGEVEVTYNKWMVDFGMATAIPESISRKPTFDYRK